MESWTKRALVIAGAAATVRAGPAPAATPQVTPVARLLPRVNERTLGWYSSSTVGETTLYSAWGYDADETTYTTSSTWFRRCAAGSTCTMYTDCSDGYLVAQDTSSFCGTGGSSSGALYCSDHILYTTMGDSIAYSWYWCDSAPLTGYTFYENEPSQSGLSSSSTPASSDASTTSASSSASTSASATRSSASAAAQTQTSSPSGGGDSTNVGAIAGGVVGGIAGLALIGAAVFFLLRRNKKKDGANAPPQGGYAPPPQQSGMYQQPGYQQPGYQQPGYSTSAYQANEAKPQGVQEMGGYYGQQQPAPYPQGLYDPHMSQYGSDPPPQQMSQYQQYAAPHTAPQAMPQELSSEHR